MVGEAQTAGKPGPQPCSQRVLVWFLPLLDWAINGFFLLPARLLRLSLLTLTIFLPTATRSDPGLVPCSVDPNQYPNVLAFCPSFIPWKVFTCKALFL